MACERFAGQLKDLAAGGAPTAALTAHLAQCAECRDTLAAERRLIGTIDADVMDALRTEPSADFEARVRLRVAAEPAAVRWFAGWRLATALASFAVVAVALALVLIRWEGADRGRRAAVAGTLVAPHTERARVEPAVPPAADGYLAAAKRSDAKAVDGVASARVSAVSRTKPAARREPEVLVAQDQQRVIARLVGMLRRGRLDEKALEQPSEAPQPPGPIVVGELTVAPIVVAPTGNEK